MSILPLTFFTEVAIGLLSITLRVKDALYVKESGVDKQSSFINRTIEAAVEASDTRRLEQIFGGPVSSGSIGIFTNEKLHFTDSTTKMQQQRQSFVYYGAYQYRVTAEADWTQQAGCFVYLAERHITQDKI